VTKSNFKADEEVQRLNIAKYVKEYIDTLSFAYEDKMDITYKGDCDFISKISVLSLSIVLDNLISNSLKAKANKVEIEFTGNKKELIILFSDNGLGVDLNLFPRTEAIFDLGVKSINEGSGIGLYTVKNKMREMYGDIEFIGNNISLKGATFKLYFK